MSSRRPLNDPFAFSAAQGGGGGGASAAAGAPVGGPFGGWAAPSGSGAPAPSMRAPAADFESAAPWPESSTSSAKLPDAGTMGMIGRSPALSGAGAGAASAAATTFDPSAALASSGFMSQQVAMLAVSGGKQLVSSSLAKYLPGALALWQSLRVYFRVDNTYVRVKLLRTLFPFLNRKWARLPPTSAGEGVEAAHPPPSADSNAPDLYIPLMAFVTYVLATGLLKGIGMTFHPEVLNEVTSKSVVLLTLEVLLLRFAMYALSVANVHTLDLLAFGGYKFVGLVLNMLAGIFFGRMAYFALYCYNAVAIFWFTMNTLFPLLRPELANAGIASSLTRTQIMHRQYLAIGAALLQCVLMFFMGTMPLEAPAPVRIA